MDTKRNVGIWTDTNPILTFNAAALMPLLGTGNSSVPPDRRADFPEEVAGVFPLWDETALPSEKAVGLARLSTFAAVPPPSESNSYKTGGKSGETKHSGSQAFHEPSISITSCVAGNILLREFA